MGGRVLVGHVYIDPQKKRPPHMSRDPRVENLLIDTFILLGLFTRILLVGSPWLRQLLSHYVLYIHHTLRYRFGTDRLQLSKTVTSTG